MSTPKTRNVLLAYMNTELDRSRVPVYKLMGEGFTNLTQLKAPSEYTRKFIINDDTTTDIIRYESEVQYTIDVFSEDPVIRMIIGITDAELLSARTDVVTVYRDEVVALPAYCKAFRRKYLIIPQQIGDDIELLRTNGRMVAYGEREDGFFDAETNRFIARTLFKGASAMLYGRSPYNIGTIHMKEV